jgi:hypothetical protein
MALGGIEMSYHEDALVRDLRIWWDDQVGGDEDDPFAAPKRPCGTIFDVVPEIDSLGAVTGLITVEKHIGFKVPASIIRRGGYSSFDDLLGDLLPKVRMLVEKRKASAGAKLKGRRAA